MSCHRFMKLRDIVQQACTGVGWEAGRHTSLGWPPAPEAVALQGAALPCAALMPPCPPVGPCWAQEHDGCCGGRPPWLGADAGGG
jgi:hypothetical protein